MLVLLLIPIFTSSLLDLEQKKANESLTAQERAKKEAEEKIYLTGKFDPSVREDFVVVPKELSTGNDHMYLRKETMEAFSKMAKAASEEKIILKIASATRNFDYQRNLWNNKWTGVTLVEGQNLSTSIPDGLMRFKKILEYSAAPGTSRHHFGTDIDINGADLGYFETEKGMMTYQWLVKNAGSYGFCQPYNLKGSSRGTGYNEEKWHWSYLPLSKNFTQEYARLIKNEDIKGFQGDEYVAQQDVINNYVLSINPECL